MQRLELWLRARATGRPADAYTVAARPYYEFCQLGATFVAREQLEAAAEHARPALAPASTLSAMPRPRLLTSGFSPLLVPIALCALFCEPAHVFSAGQSGADPGSENFAPAGTPAQYAPDRSLDLLHADIAVIPDLVGQRVVGVVEYRGKLLDPDAREITLHGVDLDVEGAWIDGERVSVRERDETLHFALPEKTEGGDRSREAGAELSLRIHWQAAPKLGLYFFGPDDRDDRREALSEGDEAPPTRGIPERRHALQSWTQGEMHETRHWLPTWDYPNDRFSTRWRVVAPAGFSVIANGEATGHAAAGASDLPAELGPGLDAGAQLWTFEQRGDHVSYLLSFIVGRFEVVREQWRQKPVEYWAPPGLADQARGTYAKTPQMLEFYSEWIGLEFPWAKYAQTSVQEFTFGGMENVSATTMTDRILHPAELEIVENKEGLIAHELAHQWWGDLLTCRSWSEIWLNEGFATYFSALWKEHADGPDEFALSRRWMAGSYLNEAHRYQRAIVTRNYRRASTMFDRHTYPKGGWVLHMLRRELGDADFRRVIARYARDNAHGLVETADLERAVREETGRNLGPFFDQWVRSPGHPQLESSWRWDPRAATVSVEIEQLQDRLFDFELDLELVGPDGDVVAQRVRVTERSAQILLPAEARPDFVLVDAGFHLLAELDQHQSERSWIAQLAGAERGIDRLRAAEALAHFNGAEVVAALRKAVADDHFHGVRSAAAKALGSIGDRRAQRALVELLDSELAKLEADPNSADPRVRRALLAGLARAEGPADDDLYDRLRERLRDDPIDHVRAAAATALTRFDGRAEADASKKDRRRAEKLHKKAIKDLRKALEQHSHNTVVEEAAARALGAIAEAKQLDLLFELIDPIRPTYLRMAGVDGLLRLRGREGVLEADERERVARAVADLLDDPNMRIRRHVVDDVADLELPDARARLRRVVERDLSSRVRSMAEDELRGL